MTREPPSPSSVEAELEQRFAEAYDENGVDRTLVRACLNQTPAERLASLEATLNFAANVRRAPNSSVSETP